MSATKMQLFTDFTCPFSYVTEMALRQLLRAGGRRIEHRALELYPAPLPLPASAAEEEAIVALRPLADEVRVRLGSPRLVPRTRKAHEAARFARGHGREDAMREAIFRAYWEETLDVGRIDVLSSLAGPIGLEAEELKIALDIDALADDVARDRAVAERLGVQQTPTLIVPTAGEAMVMVGAHPLQELRAMLERADG